MLFLLAHSRCRPRIWEGATGRRAIDGESWSLLWSSASLSATCVCPQGVRRPRRAPRCGEATAGVDVHILDRSTLCVPGVTLASRRPHPAEAARPVPRRPACRGRSKVARPSSSSGALAARARPSLTRSTTPSRPSPSISISAAGTAVAPIRRGPEACRSGAVAIHDVRFVVGGRRGLDERGPASDPDSPGTGPVVEQHPVCVPGPACTAVSPTDTRAGWRASVNLPAKWGARCRRHRPRSARSWPAAPRTVRPGRRRGRRTSATCSSYA